jgi:hypothetical protein
VTVPNSVLAEVKKCTRSWTLEIVRGATHLFEEPGSRVCRRIGQGLLSQVPGAGWHGATAQRGFSRRCAFALCSRQKMQSSFRFAQDGEI